MPVFSRRLPLAPRISPLLLHALARLDDLTVPIAETNRRLGAEAERLGLTRPSYQRVRELVHEQRRGRATRSRLRVAVALGVTVERESSSPSTSRRRLEWLAGLVTLCYLVRRSSARPP